MSNTTASEPEGFSDSDWLDISSTDRESDDNDSVFSSRRGTDHELLSSRSRSRRSSVSYSSSRDGDVEVWEGMADDDEQLDGAQSPALASPTAFDDIQLATKHSDDPSTEELRVKEGLDQSMVSTLSSSRSSSLHASTVHNSLRDLRLSFPDPLTSSREELTPSPHEDIAVPDATRTATDGYVMSNPLDNAVVSPPDAASLLSPHTQCVSEFNVFLYGLSTPFKWSVIDTLLGKVAQGAGFTITTTLQGAQGSIRQLSIIGHSKSSKPFPRLITVTDKTAQDQHTTEDPSLMCAAKFPPLAVVYMPSCSPHIPEHAYYLPILAPPTSADVADTQRVACAAQESWDIHHVPRRQVICLSPSGHSAVVDKCAVDELDPSTAYRAFSGIWSTNKKAANRISINRSHALTIIAVLSLLFGVIVRSMFPSATRVVVPSVTVAPSTCGSTPLWQLLRSTVEHPKQAMHRHVESSSVVTMYSVKDLALSVFNSESTSLSLHSTHSLTDTPKLHRMMPSTLHERFLHSKDLILRPALSVLALESNPSTTFAEPSATVSHDLVSASASASASASTALIQSTAPDFIKEYMPVVSAVIMNEMYAIMDALDALMQAISKQAHALAIETAALVQWSVSQVERSAETMESVKDALHARNVHAKKRAKELKERGTRWLLEAGEVVARRTESSKRNAKVLAEGIANRARRARSNAKKMAEDVQGCMQDQEGLVLRALDMGEKQWKLWQKRVGKRCSSKRTLEGAAFC